MEENNFSAFEVKEVINAETGDKIDFKGMKFDKNLNINAEEQKFTNSKQNGIL